MRSVTNFPEHVHPMYTAAASLQGEEYFANTRSLSQLTDTSHIITWAEMSMMSTYLARARLTFGPHRLQKILALRKIEGAKAKQ